MSPEHRKTVRHFEQSPHLHELTFSCYLRMPLLTNNVWREVLSRSLQAACEAEQFALVAFVFMPEHVHLLVWPISQKATVSRLLARIKQPVSAQIRAILESCHSPLLGELTVQERPGNTCFRFWQEGGGFDRNLFTPAAIAASIDYIHRNPVQRGLCERATDYQWSSARFHLLGIEDHTLPKLMKPEPEWFHQFGQQSEIA